MRLAPPRPDYPHFEKAPDAIVSRRRWRSRRIDWNGMHSFCRARSATDPAWKNAPERSGSGLGVKKQIPISNLPALPRRAREEAVVAAILGCAICPESR